MANKKTFSEKQFDLQSSIITSIFILKREEAHSRVEAEPYLQAVLTYTDVIQGIYHAN